MTRNSTSKNDANIIWFLFSFGHSLLHIANNNIHKQNLFCRLLHTIFTSDSILELFPLLTNLFTIHDSLYVDWRKTGVDRRFADIWAHLIKFRHYCDLLTVGASGVFPFCCELMIEPLLSMQMIQ